MRLTALASLLAATLVAAPALAADEAGKPADAAAKPADAAAAPAAGATDPAIKALFNKKCAMCHGEDGKAQTKMGQKHKIDSFVDAAWQAKESDEEIRKAISDGVPDTKMKAWKSKLSAAEIDGLAKYVRTFNPAPAK